MRKDQFFKLVALIGGAALFLSVKVHAYEVRVKQPKQLPTYQVCDTHAENCREMNAADATIAKLQDKSRRVFKITKTEVEVTQGSKGLDLDKK